MTDGERHGGSGPRSRLGLLLAVLLLVVLAGALDLVLLRRSTLWVDEIFSLAIATGHSVEQPAAEADAARGDFVQAEMPVPLDELRRYVARETPAASIARVVRAVYLSDTNPPLYYVALHAWTQLAGSTDGALRAFSVGWVLACLPFLLALAARVGGPGAVWSTGLLFVASPIAAYYGTEGRMYSLLWFWTVAAAWLTLQWADTAGSPAARRWSAAWILASAGGLLTHYFFLFPWCGLSAFLLWKAVRRRSGRAAPDRTSLPTLGLAVLGTALLVLPWYWHLPDTLRRWRVTQDWLNLVPHDFHRLRAARDLALQFFSNDGHYLWWDHPDARVVLFFAFGLLGLAALLRLRARLWSGERLLLWLWFGAAWAGPLVFDAVRGTYTVAVPRYAISALPAAALLGGLALAALPRTARWGLLAVIVGVWTYSLRSIYDNPSRDDQPFWKLGQILGAEAGEKDLILVHSIPTGAIGVARYTQSPARVAPWVEQLGSRRVPGSIETLAQGARRIFFIRIHEVGAEAPVEDWLRHHADVVREQTHGVACLIVFEPRQRTGLVPLR